MSDDLTKILPENQKEMPKLIAPLNKKQTVHVNVQDSDSEPEKVSVTRTSTPVKTNTATVPKTTPANSRNNETMLRLPGNETTLVFLSKTVAWGLFLRQGVSQTTACDGIFYQIPAGDNALIPAPGVLPI